MATTMSTKSEPSAAGKKGAEIPSDGEDATMFYPDDSRASTRTRDRSTERGRRTYGIAGSARSESGEAR